MKHLKIHLMSIDKHIMVPLLETMYALKVHLHESFFNVLYV